MRFRIALSTAFLLAVIALAGCHSKPPESTERRYPIEGQVVAVDATLHTLTMAHHDIPGYMKAMTMSFTVRDSWVFDVVKPGDTVQATLVVDDHSYLENIAVTQSRRAADLSSTSPVRLPEPGEPVPDFRFVNQQGRPIHLAQFRGEPLLITFIYTRCPLPDYCVRMSNNFAEVARILRDSNPTAFARLQMLSITIDPEFDNPKVLRGYGKGYAGAVDPGLKHWSFATGSPEAIRKAAEYFGLSYLPQNGEVVHNLRTTLVDADGKVAELYTGNDWKPADVAAKLQDLQR